MGFKRALQDDTFFLQGMRIGSSYWLRTALTGACSPLSICQGTILQLWLTPLGVSRARPGALSRNIVAAELCTA
eukprot:969059-Alexandrium_andersonii.AAC.1